MHVTTQELRKRCCMSPDQGQTLLNPEHESTSVSAGPSYMKDNEELTRASGDPCCAIYPFATNYQFPRPAFALNPSRFQDHLRHPEDAPSCITPATALHIARYLTRIDRGARLMQRATCFFGACGRRFKAGYDHVPRYMNFSNYPQCTPKSHRNDIICFVLALFSVNF